MAKRGANVILACRDRNKGEKAANEIILKSSNDKVELEILDLASLKSVKAFSERIKSKCKRLDILVNNAGRILFISGLIFLIQ